MKQDMNNVEELMKILNDTNLTEVTFEEKEFKVKVKRPKVVAVPAVAEVCQVEETEEIKNYKEIKSFHIGKFYYVDKQGDSLIKVGEKIEEGQNIGFIKTVGVTTTIRSTFTGIVKEILVENGNIADYGKTLVKVELD